MKLIHRNELTWDDLAKIESPWFALHEVREALKRGCFIHLEFGQGISDSSSKAEQEKFLNDIECGQLFMIHDNPLWHQPFSPILRYNYDGRCIKGESTSGAYLEHLVERLYDTKFSNAGEAKAWMAAFYQRRYPPVTVAKKEEKLVSVSRKNFYQGLGTGGGYSSENNYGDDTIQMGSKPKITDDGRVIPYGKTAAESKAIRMPEGAEKGKYHEINGQEAFYDDNGFIKLDSKFDTIIDKKHIGSQNEREHFKAANENLRVALKKNPSLAKKIGLTKAQVKHIEKNPSIQTPPPDMTWHHHQDTGRIQLVDDEPHGSFRHTGGMAIWGGGYRPKK